MVRPSRPSGTTTIISTWRGRWRTSPAAEGVATIRAPGRSRSSKWFVLSDSPSLLALLQLAWRDRVVAWTSNPVRVMNTAASDLLPISGLALCSVDATTSSAAAPSTARRRGSTRARPGARCRAPRLRGRGARGLPRQRGRRGHLGRYHQSRPSVRVRRRRAHVRGLASPGQGRVSRRQAPRGGTSGISSRTSGRSRAGGPTSCAAAPRRRGAGAGRRGERPCAARSSSPTQGARRPPESVVRRWVDYYLSRGFDRVCFYVHDQSLIYGIEGTAWFVLD